MDGTPAAIAGSDEAALSFARWLAEALGMRPFEVPEESRAAYHAAAAISSNLLVALEESAAQLVERLGIEDARELLTPLVLRTAANWAERGPAALTGPIARGDRAIVERHRAVLAETAPELIPMYDALAERAEAVMRGARRAKPRATGSSERASVKIVRSKTELREALAEPRREGKRIGLVPTMGYFHEGHLSLMREAREDCDVVVVSLFVNPTQFGPGEDLDSYPRDEDRDAELAALEGVDLLWTPDTDEMYPEGFATSVEVGQLAHRSARGRPGASRSLPLPRRHHRRRQALQLGPARRRLLRAKGRPAGRRDRADGPRPRLPGRDRGAADRPRGGRPRAELPQRLPDGGAARAGDARSPARCAPPSAQQPPARLPPKRWSQAARDELRRAGIEPEYVEARAAEDLSPIAELNGRPVLVAVAARVGKARLIDNVVITPRTEV